MLEKPIAKILTADRQHESRHPISTLIAELQGSQNTAHVGISMYAANLKQPIYKYRRLRFLHNVTLRF